MSDLEGLCTDLSSVLEISQLTALLLDSGISMRTCRTVGSDGIALGASSRLGGLTMAGRTGGAVGGMSGDRTGEDEWDFIGGRKAVELLEGCDAGPLRGGGSFRAGAGAFAAFMTSAM